MIKIEIIAIGKDKIYSAGYVKIYKKGDIYHIYKMAGSDFHMSRHASGELHLKYVQGNFVQLVRRGQPIKNFKGMEFFGTTAFGLDSLPKLFSEYKMKKCSGIFAVDMRHYKEAAFNMSIGILTEESLPELNKFWSNMKKRQFYLFADCSPMIAIAVCDARQ